MNEEICCITNKRKTAKNLRALYSVYKKIRIIFFDTLLAIHHSVASYKYFEKLISMKTMVLGFSKILCIAIIPLMKLLNFRKRKIDITNHCTPNSISACILPHMQ